MFEKHTGVLGNLLKGGNGSGNSGCGGGGGGGGGAVVTVVPYGTPQAVRYYRQSNRRPTVPKHKKRKAVKRVGGRKKVGKKHKLTATKRKYKKRINKKRKTTKRFAICSLLKCQTY